MCVWEKGAFRKPFSAPLFTEHRLPWEARVSFTWSKTGPLSSGVGTQWPPGGPARPAPACLGARPRVLPDAAPCRSLGAASRAVQTVAFHQRTLSEQLIAREHGEN